MPTAHHANLTWPVPVHAQSLAYFCSTCGSLWAHITVDPPTGWQIINRPCSYHSPRSPQDWFEVPGSLTVPEGAGVWAAAAYLTVIHPNLLPAEAQAYLRNEERKLNDV